MKQTPNIPRNPGPDPSTALDLVRRLLSPFDSLERLRRKSLVNIPGLSNLDSSINLLVEVDLSIMEKLWALVNHPDRFICTQTTPWSPDRGDRVIHLDDIKETSSGDTWARYKCGACGQEWKEELPQ